MKMGGFFFFFLLLAKTESGAHGEEVKPQIAEVEDNGKHIK